MFTTGAIVSVTTVFNIPKTEAATFTSKLIQEDLFFRRNISGSREVFLMKLMVMPAAR